MLALSRATAWTGGQYSLVRALLGLYLALHFLVLIPWGPELFSDRGMLPDASLSPFHAIFPNLLFVLDGAGSVVALLVVGALASGLLAAGIADRVAALGLWYIWACLFTRNPFIANPSLPFIGWLLLAHAALPAAPYGSWAARRRADPGGGWRMPREIFVAAWIVMAVGYSYSGYTKLISPSWLDGSALARVLANPLARPTLLRELLLALPASVLALGTWGSLALELLFAPLALVRLLRPWIWAALLSMHLGLMVLIDFSDLSFGMVVLHAFTFDPAWIPVRRTDRDQPLLLFYDGDCGLCHRAVRFLLAEDRAGVFRFAPLGGERAAARLGSMPRGALPDSIVLALPAGGLLVRSSALVEIGLRLGGLWAVCARLASAVPVRVRDAAYDFVASVRHRLFARPDAACPLLTPELRERFDF